MAAILSLMSHPEKPLSQQGEVTCRDSDISWCLDSLHGFYREESPSVMLTYYEVKRIPDLPHPRDRAFCGLFNHLNYAHGIEERYPIFTPKNAVHEYQELIAAMELLGVFQKEISEALQTLGRMRKEWMKTYQETTDEKDGGRFKGSSRELTMENWEKLTAHAGCLYGELLKQIDEIQKGIRIHQRHVSFMPPPSNSTP
ncbi:hypothetical protein E0Z10_g9717 [Xylaria hypoxylon]|uniref:Uncharacterized protein n=1 Tax=Xylaria hypoxylon TaxID=37992 RepID=A0A4Z0YIE1_9PEZI|nr:hypothetical protein E0Z10_g9717 [Xylaria hypoxylon]